MRKQLSLISALSVALCGAAAAADDQIFSLRGFGTLGAVYSDEDQADFVSQANTQPKGAGATKSVSMDVDSKLALQLDAKFTERLTAVVQLVSESQNNNSWNSKPNPTYRPSLEWANLKYQINDELSVRAGRIVLPLLMVSEYRKVGYANHWVRAPVEVYGGIPFTSSDGADITYRTNVGNAISTTQVHYGINNLPLSLGKVESSMYGVNSSVQVGDLTVHAAVVIVDPDFKNFHLEAPLQVFEGVAGSIPGGLTAAAVADSARIRNQYLQSTGSVTSYDIAVSYDPGPWFAMAEAYRYVASGVFLPDTDSGYVTGGVRLRNWTPYATIARAKVQARHEAISATGIPDIDNFAAALGGLLAGTVNLDTSQTTVSLGVRWDFMKNTSLKAQWDHIDLDDGSPGYYKNFKPGFEPGSSSNALSIAVDYMF